MKTYVTSENTEIKKKKKKSKKDKKSVVTKKDFGLTENARIVME